MIKEIKNATNEQVNDALKGILFVVRKNKTNGFDFDEYCTIKDVEKTKKQLSELKAELDRYKAEIKELKDDNTDLRKGINKEGIEYLTNLKTENERLESELDWERRNKICIVKQLDDPKSYVYLEDYNEFKTKNEKLEAENERLKIENIAINQVAEYVGKIGENETALEEYNTSQQNKILMFNNKRLLQQLKEKDEEIARLKKFESVYYLNQLQASDKAINEYKKTMFNSYATILELNEKLKTNTHQVCEKIRNKVTRQTYICGGKATEQDVIEANSYNRCLADVRDILDQIEKGETNDTKREE